MLAPKRSKYRKSFRGKRRGMAIRGSTLSFGEYGLKSLGRGWLKANQIEAGRRAITHSMKKGGRLWVRVFPDKSVTGRAAGQRMGSGKGEVVGYVAVIRPGRILYEVAGVDKVTVLLGFAKAAAKLPFSTKIVSREV